jgi:hypothetical protein
MTASTQADFDQAFAALVAGDRPHHIRCTTCTEGHVTVRQVAECKALADSYAADEAAADADAHDDYLAERAYALYREGISERGTWWGADRLEDRDW